MTTIKSLVPGFTGRAYIGPVILDFKDGVAEHEGDLSEGVRSYLTENGYGVDAAPNEPEDAPEPTDPRKQDREQVGTRLRDAATDPDPEDYLPPTNAGKANPHGSKVVAPQIHATQGVRPVKGGDVHTDDTEAQEAAETAHTEDVQEDGTAPAPAGNASTETWRDYAISRGVNPDTAADMNRDELRAAVQNLDTE